MRLRAASQQDLWQEIRRRMIDETNSFLSQAVDRPELGVSIPIFVVGKGEFGRPFAEEFWRQVLEE